MPDVSMCFGGDCPLKNNCYRYRAIPNEFRQAYFCEPPYRNGKCDEFWDAEKSGYRLQEMKKDDNSSKNS